MQSTVSTWFCTTCGAANDVGQAACFSCHRARVEHTQLASTSGLLQGRYLLLAQVGVGGFGEVYKALDTWSADRVVAIKQINLRGLTPQRMIEATDTFNREIQILPSLTHPNLPRVYDHFTDPDHWYMVMEFLEGETLERYLETRLRQRSYAGAPGLLPLEEIFALAFQLCDVLDYLHTRQPPIIFRDLKPANIMRTSIDHFYLIDFGIARLFTPGRARDTTPLGSPGYAAPEQYGKAQTTPRSDLYGLGALLHYLVTRDDPSETPFRFAPLPQFSQTTPGGMQALETLIKRMVDIDSSQRPASSREVKEELQHIAYLVAASAAPRIWSPPPSLPPDPEVEGALQQQVQLQIQKHKATTRRKFLRRSLIGGGVLILGGALVGPVLNNLFTDNQYRYSGGSDFRKDPGVFRGQQSVSDISWSSDGKQIAFISTTVSVPGYNGSSSTNSTLSVYQIDQNNVHDLFSDLSVISALAWAHDMKHIAIGYSNGFISLIDTSLASTILSFSGSSGSVERIAWSPDGKLIAAGGVQEVLRICNASDGTIVSTYTGTTVNEIRFLSWSPDSKRIVIESDTRNAQSSQSTLQVWDVTAGKTLFTFADVNMLQVAWSPDGNVIASVGNDHTVYLWNASHGTLIKSYGVYSDPHVNPLLPVELLWSPDSKNLALDNRGADLQIWNTQNNNTRGVPAFLNASRAMIWLSNEQLALIDASKTRRIIDVGDL
jgi:eukaryotic-like serine/threonine-protein kinase